MTAEPKALDRMLEEASGLSTKNGVCQGADAMNEIGMPVTVLDDTACCWCVTGALFVVGADQPAQLMVAATWALAGLLDPERGDGYRDAVRLVQDWADEDGRTADDILALFEGAREGARTRRYVVSFDGDGDARVSSKPALRSVPTGANAQNPTEEDEDVEAPKKEGAAAISKKIAALRFKLKHAGTGRTGAPKKELTADEVAEVEAKIAELAKKREEAKAA